MTASLLLLLTVAAAALVDDAALVRRMLAGQRAAGRLLLARLWPVIRARAYRRLRRAPPGVSLDVEDLAQDVWLRLLREEGEALRGFDPGRGVSLEGYVGMLAERTALKVLERHRAAKRGGGRAAVELADAPHAGATEDNLIEQRDLLSRLAAHLEAALPTKGLLVFRLLYTDGHSVPEAAAALGCTAQVIYNWQFKIRSLSRAFLAEAEGRA